MFKLVLEVQYICRASSKDTEFARHFTYFCLVYYFMLMRLMLQPNLCVFEEVT